MISQPSESMPSALAHFSAIASTDVDWASLEAAESRMLPQLDFDAPIYGTERGDRLYGDANPDAPNDLIFAAAGKDRIRGKEGNDVLFGGEGEDRIRGDAGGDVLWGGLGDDRLTGDRSRGKGEDVFVLARGSGTDRILDFQVDSDYIGLVDGLTFGQLEFSQSGRDAVILDRESGEALARLQDIDVDSLSDRLFVSAQSASPVERGGETDIPEADVVTRGAPASGEPAFSEPISGEPTSSSVSNRPLQDTPSALDAVTPADPGLILQSNSAHWAGHFSSGWEGQWDLRQKGAWGEENFEVRSAPNGSDVLRVHYPKGSATPSVSRKEGVPIGGGQFYADLSLPPQDSLRLGYSVRFSDNFDFVKGGKLPGLFGGQGASGGNIPDGTDGFSTRLMWRREGEGEVYAYLPTSKGYGTSIGRGAWTFEPGQWHHVEQEVVLNEPGQSDGQVRVWHDGNLVLEQRDLTFRTTDELKLDGVFFSTFFGGGDRSWATPKDVYADFANFSVSVPN